MIPEPNILDLARDADDDLGEIDSLGRMPLVGVPSVWCARICELRQIARAWIARAEGDRAERFEELMDEIAGLEQQVAELQEELCEEAGWRVARARVRARNRQVLAALKQANRQLAALAEENAELRRNQVAAATKVNGS